MATAKYVYHVAYDLVRPGQKYPELWAYLERIGVRALLSAWLVETPMLAAELRDALARFIDDNDRLIITEITNSNWAGKRWLPGSGDWLKRRFP